MTQHQRAKGQGMNWIRQEKRLAIYIRDDFTCQHCGLDLHNIRPSDGFRITLDHIVPVAREGTNNATNLITSCSTCNERRGTKLIEVMHPHGTHAILLFQAARPINIHLAKQVLEKRKLERE